MTEASTDDTRIERDSLGELSVPAGALYGIHTVRAIANFCVGGPTLSVYPELLSALAAVKLAAVRANLELGILSSDVAEAIGQAAGEIVAGAWHDQFPMEIVQGGGGTASNMNMNEVLANRAEELLGGERGRYRLVHPIDHVNRSQSTNDVYPTAGALAVHSAGRQTEADLRHLERALHERATTAGDLMRLGRTCLQDALPVPAAATHTATAHALRRCREALSAALGLLLVVPLGGTAVGTGLGAPAGYAKIVTRLLAEERGLAIVPARDRFDAIRHLDELLAVAQATARAALVLRQSAADLRLLSSGPAGGLGELRLPKVQVGSSSMPGKVNPVIPELVIQVAFEIQAAAGVVEQATAAGELELNVMEPVALRSALDALRQLGAVSRLYADRCIAGLRWVPEGIEASLRGSLEAAVARAGEAGYAVAAAESKEHAGPGALRGPDS